MDDYIGSDNLFSNKDKEELYSRLTTKQQKQFYTHKSYNLKNVLLSLVLVSILFLIGYMTVTEIQKDRINSSGEPNSIIDENDTTNIPVGDFTVYEDVLTAEDIEVDIDGDGQNERIILNISPAPVPDPDNEGQYLWDSSQVWQLLVQDEGEYYTLFDDHVHGLAEMYVVNEENNQNAIVFQQKGTNMNLSVFRYKDGYFEKSVVYNSGMILHRSAIK